jgi:error-prone DNA polymerase
MLLEDEGGTINLIVPPDVYERDRLIVRTEPLVLAEGRLERLPAGGGQVNVLVRRLWPLAAPDGPLAAVREIAPPVVVEIGGEDEGEAVLAAVAAGADDFRAVAPPVMSFAQGRRR